jgi:hypothetical protein
MRSAQTLAVVILVACLISGLHLDTPITCVIPFMGGMPPRIQDAVGVAIILTTLWGLQHLRRNHSEPSKRVRRFRWSLLLVPAVCILAVWVLNHAQPALGWEEIFDRCDIHGEERIRISRLVALGILCIGTVVIKAIWVRE